MRLRARGRFGADRRARAEGEFDAGAAFSAGVAAAKRLAGKPRDEVAVGLALAVDVRPPSAPRPWSRASSSAPAGPASARPSRAGIRSEPSRSSSIPTRRPSPPASSSEPVRRGEIVGQAINLARDLANTPPPRSRRPRLAEQIRTVAADAGIGVRRLGRGRGSAQERFGGPARRRRRLGRAPGVRRPRVPQGRRRARRWPWSARGSRSTPAASRSSRAPRWRT